MQLSFVRLLSVLVLVFPLQAQDNPVPAGTGRQSQQKQVAAAKETAIVALESIFDDVRQIEDLPQRVMVAEALVPLVARKHPAWSRKFLESLLDNCVDAKKTQKDEQKNIELNADALAGKIVDIAARFDRKLAQSLLAKYTADTALDEQDSSKEKGDSAKTKFYLKIATQLVERDPMLAASVGASAVTDTIIPETLVFLRVLRQKDSRTADKLFSSALHGVQSRGGRDPNELLLLFSFVFSPPQVLVVTPQGLAAYQIPDYASAPQEAPNSDLARQFLEVAVDLLLDPNRYNPTGVEPSQFGPVGDWHLIAVLEAKVSFYRRDLADALGAQRLILEGQLQTQQKVDASSAIDRSKADPQPGDKSRPTENSDNLLKRAEQTNNDKRKDQLFYRAAMAAVGEKQYDRALEIGDKISVAYRDEALDFLKLDMALAAVHQQEFDRASRLAEKQNDFLKRAFISTAIAKALLDAKEKDQQQVRIHLAAAEATVPKLNNDQERVAALAGISEVYSRYDNAEAFRCLGDAIRYANKVDRFSGGIAQSRMLNIGGFYFAYPLYADTLLTEVVSTLGLSNLNATLQEVRQLESRPARIAMTIAACKTVLSSKS